MLSGIMLNAIMLSVIMLNVVAPKHHACRYGKVSLTKVIGFSSKATDAISCLRLKRPADLDLLLDTSFVALASGVNPIKNIMHKACGMAKKAWPQ